MKRLMPEASVFLGGGLLVWLVIKVAIPLLSARGFDAFAGWMVLSSVFVFVPVVVAGYALLASEGPRAVGRLRLRKPTRGDWLWFGRGALIIVCGSLALNALVQRLGLPVSPFVRVPAPWPWWMLLIWVAHWPLNILGEEFTWRAVILPRMELLIGSRAWVLNSLLWASFHTAFGPGNILVVLPTLIVVPFTAQRTQSTWIAVALHAFVSLPGMAMMALGKL